MTYEERIEAILNNLKANAPELHLQAESASQQGASDFFNGKCEDFKCVDHASYMYVSGFVEEAGHADQLV
jgi:hypothetical protein